MVSVEFAGDDYFTSQFPCVPIIGDIIETDKGEYIVCSRKFNTRWSKATATCIIKKV